MKLPHISILTLFPEFFKTPFESSLLGKAVQQGVVTVSLVNIRDFGVGKYNAVDDKPFGGGPGMLMSPVVLEKALQACLGEAHTLDLLEEDVKNLKADSSASAMPWVVYLSPQGCPWTSTRARQLAQSQRPLILICGHYEGLDERFLNAFVHEEISIGDFVLTGGEPAALVVTDCISRFVPGVVGDQASVEMDTFEAGADMVPGGLKYPMYTRPALWRGRAVPAVLTSGNHGAVAQWRFSQSQERTLLRRPDLFKKK